MKLFRVSYRRNLILIYFIISILFSLTLVNMPVKSDPYETRLYIRESPPGSWIPGVTPAPGPPGEVWVTVDIESPIAWDNTKYGIVGYRFSIQVDPNVLTVVGAFAENLGYFLYDFIDWNYMGSDYYPELLVEETNGTAGTMTGIGELIKGFPDLGVGAGGNSTNTDALYWYGETNGMTRLRFISKTKTGFTPIDIYDAYWVDMNETEHAFDVVDDGQYNQEPVYLTVDSIPFDGIDFTINPTYTTNTTIELQPGDYTVTMPLSVTYEGVQFNFVEWEDASTNRVRSISMTTNMTIIATYVYGGPPLEANLVGRSAWKEHAHFDVSKHGNESIDDPKGTPGYQTLFAKVKNIGEGNVTVKVEFELMIGLTPAEEFPMVTDTAIIIPGEIIVLTVDFAGIDGYPWDDPDDIGKWTMKATCKYYVPGVGWLSGTKIKTSKFTVVL